MGKAKGSSMGVRWVGDASLIAENKAATTSWQSDNDQGNPQPRGGEAPGIGLGKKGVGSMGTAKPARKSKAKARAGSGLSSRLASAPPKNSSPPVKKKK
jgi:hypothetical protein